jgi:hypothetical protein
MRKIKYPHKKSATGLLAIILLTTGCVSALNAKDDEQQTPSYTLDGQGELIRPTDYRSWIYVGTPVTPNDMNNGKAAFPEHHNVYIDHESYKHYLKTGEWREGTILVKELVSVGTKQAVSGNGYFQGDFIGLEATIKSKADFPDEPGNWAYFSFTNHEEPNGELALTAAPFPSASCNSCHAASAQDDFVFTQHYPVLRAAKGMKTTPENKSARPKTTIGSTSPSGEAESITFDQSDRSDIWKATATTPVSVEGTSVPTGQDTLFEFLQGKSYQNWDTKEAQNHPSRGPHTNYGKPVRAYFNDTLASSMTAGNQEHPVGATAVKEMFDASGTLEGWAVEIKTQPTSDDGDGWFWYEVTSVTDASMPVAIGNGVEGCFSCHATGAKDFVKSTWPFN